MSRDARTRSASLASVLVTTANVKDYLLGFVENFHASETYATELTRVVGRAHAKENVMHGVEQATISWSGYRTAGAGQDQQEIGVGPTLPGITAFNPITVKFFDQDRGELMLEVVDVLPRDIGFSGNAMNSLKDSFNGVGIHCKWPVELNA